VGLCVEKVSPRRFIFMSLICWTQTEMILVVVWRLWMRLMLSGSGLFGKVSAYVDLKALKILAASSRWAPMLVSQMAVMSDGLSPSIMKGRCSL
jgi:hypothetical protein